ncbi:MAG: hypothetical protein JNJ46_18935 [Myxococcales bacterium]|nr:hypothetical protein [Myxococcales bacterium]
MATERFAVTVLPYSVAAGEPFHVSLYVSPRLSPDGGSQPLRAFPLFCNFGHAIAEDVEFVLVDDTGFRYKITRASEVDPTLWPMLFPPDTVVRERQASRFSGRTWRSFAAKRVADLGKGVHSLSTLTSPIELHSPLRSPLSLGLKKVLQQQFKLSPDRHAYDEREVTERLDTLLMRRIELRGVNPVGLSTSTHTPTVDELLLGALLDSHEVRRFYERKETNNPFCARPNPSAVRAALPKPAPDFHERLSLLNDHPELLRLMGLVIDLKVDASQLDTLRRAQWLQASIHFAGPRRPGLQLPPSRTLVKVSGQALLTVPESQDFALGRLRLGDSERFAVLDVDPDASGIKQDRFVWTLPRLWKLEQTGEPVNAAPPTIRSTGFTVVRNGRHELVQARVEAAKAKDAALESAGLALQTEDLLRGYRVEVYDHQAHRWFSLHQRKSVLRVGQKTVSTSMDGFVRTGAVSETSGVPNSDLYVHEALFGWEGWSLSVPYPGRTLRHEGGSEAFYDGSDGASGSLVLAQHDVVPGSLPRLRYGRSYSFRAWTVDLAGNSAPHTLTPRPPVVPRSPLPPLHLPDSPVPPTEAPPVSSRLPLPARNAADAPWLAALRSLAKAELAGPQLAVSFAQDASGASSAPLVITGQPAVDRFIGDRLSAGIAPLEFRRAGVQRREQVTRSVAAVLQGTAPLVSDTAAWSTEALSSLSNHVAVLDPSVSLEGRAALTLDTVTAPQPFLRWASVSHPVVVARRRFSEGESLHHVVIRSRVVETEGGQLVVEPWSETPGQPGDHGYRAQSERHLLPPKTTQNEAERHGCFDFAIGSQDKVNHQRAFQMALRESGTLLDVDVPDLNDPGVRHSQSGIALVNPNPSQPIDLATRKRDEALPQGSYVVHDTDSLRVPWLPDPLAAGVTLTFPDANADRAIRWPLNIESVTVPYSGTWPEPMSYRLMLTHGAQLAANVQGAVLQFALPPAAALRLRSSSQLSDEALAVLGPWQMLPDAARSQRVLQEAAKDGWLWSLTPGEDMQLVHAVQRPIARPRPTIILPVRQPGSTTVTLAGVVDCDGPSTGRLDIEASWTDQVDDVGQHAPSQQKLSGHVLGFTLDRDEDFVVLHGVNGSVPVPTGETLRVHAANHALGDTRHRRIRYTFRGTTRFKEYFAPDVYANDTPYVDSEAKEVSVPASTPPATPEVLQVMPLFRWEEGPEPDQPFAFRRTRRAGLRLYLARPWFSSGNDEKLAVLLAPPAGAEAGSVSEWGADPAWKQRGPAKRAMAAELDSFLHAIGADDRQVPAGPCAAPRVVTNERFPKGVYVLPYSPEYNPDRELWMVDIGIRPGPTLWPFVRLQVARYQQESLPGCELSTSVRCDFALLPPERSFTLARPDDQTARVVVSGPIALGRDGLTSFARSARDGKILPQELHQAIAENRILKARLERRDPGQRSDLAWQTVQAVELTVEGYDLASHHVSWVGSLTLPKNVAAAQPGHSHEFRVTVEEEEILPADYEGPPLAVVTTQGSARRTVYADTMAL